MTVDGSVPPDTTLVATGIASLDEILHGGLVPHRVYLVEGSPGCGKTTLGLQYLLEGAGRGERCLYIMLSETRTELQAIARSHGWALEGIDVCELPTPGASLNLDSQYKMFHPAELELDTVNQAILDAVQQGQPQRVVIDALSELRLMAQSPLRHRRQILALKRFFVERGCTVLLLDDGAAEAADLHLRTEAHGVIVLERHTPEFGATRRRLSVLKMRGADFADSYHDFVIRRGGLQIFPRIVTVNHTPSFPHRDMPSGIAALDAMLGGGLPAGSSTLLMGPAGSGKSSLGMQYALAAANAGEGAAIFAFEESTDKILARAEGIGMDLAGHIDAGRIHLQQVDPGILSPGEFNIAVRHAAEPDGGPGARVIVIDSLNGYLNAMPQERFLMLQLHELLTYLGDHGVITLLVMAQHGTVYPDARAPVDTTYLVDNVILLRYFETAGRIRPVLSVIKRRSGWHERTIRELIFDRSGIHLGEPLQEVQGVLTGVPAFMGPASTVVTHDHE
jgi:circadian clock protein KaiC